MNGLYKVLRDSKPCHGGGAYAWKLPTKNKDGTQTPGEWCEVMGPLALCSNGLHLTDDPAQWWMDGTQLYRAEYEGEEQHDEGGDKYCCRRVRLLEEVDWSVGQVYREGAHTVTRGKTLAVGSAHVVAWDSAHVVARGSAHVMAWDSAHVVAWGSAHVVARDGAHVEAWDSAHVESTAYHRSTAEVALSQMAAHVDRRNGKVVLRCAGKELEVFGMSAAAAEEKKTQCAWVHCREPAAWLWREKGKDDWPVCSVHQRLLEAAHVWGEWIQIEDGQGGDDGS